MKKFSFPGQQSGEKILYFGKPHRSIVYIAFIKLFVVGVLGIIALGILSALIEIGIFAFIMFIIIAIFIFLGVVWAIKTYEGNRLFITDRRIVKFTSVFPFSINTRMLFWDDVLKSKTFRKNALLENFLGVGSLEIRAKSQEKDNINMDYVIFHEDLSNYIDKILYIYKNNPEELQNLASFVNKPRGQRY